MAGFDEVLCTRTLEHRVDDRLSAVTICVWQPIFEQAAVDVGNYRCRFEIAGLSEPIVGEATGIDGFQAIVRAFTAIVYALLPFHPVLTWLGGQFDEHSIFEIDDAGRRRRVQAILDDDEYALDEAQRRHKIIISAKSADRLRRSKLPHRSSAVAPRIARLRRRLTKNAIQATAYANARVALDFVAAGQPTLCMRRLQFEGIAAVEVRLGWPRRSMQREDLYECDFEIRGILELVRSRAPGVDSMQAVTSALRSVAAILKPLHAKLSWFGVPYEDAMQSLNVFDAGRHLEIRAILAQEAYAVRQSAAQRRINRSLPDAQWRWAKWAD